MGRAGCFHRQPPGQRWLALDVLNEANDRKICLDWCAEIEAYCLENQSVAFSEVCAHSPREQQERTADELANQAIPAASQENRLPFRTAIRPRPERKDNVKMQEVRADRNGAGAAEPVGERVSQCIVVEPAEKARQPRRRRDSGSVAEENAILARHLRLQIQIDWQVMH